MKVNHFLFFRSISIGKSVGGIALERKGRRAEWTTWEGMCGV